MHDRRNKFNQLASSNNSQTKKINNSKTLRFYDEQMSKTTKRKEVSRGPESSIDAMLLMKVHGRTKTPR
jgi:hypothetical protein